MSISTIAQTADQAEILLWAFQHSSDGMLVTDLEGRVVSINDAFVKMFGYDRSEVIGNRTSFLKSRSSTADFYTQMWRSLNTSGEWKGEITNTKKSGEEVVCFLTITSIVSDSGKKLGYLGVEIDLTERKLLEARYNQNRQLASLGEALATLAHEIRNPLNGIKMNTYLLEKTCKERTDTTEEITESLELIGKETKRLQEMVERVLSFARGHKLHPERVLVGELIEEVLKIEAGNAESKGVSIEIVIENQLMVLCDVSQMKQVLINVVQNAIDASSQNGGCILIEASRCEHYGGEAVSMSGNAVVIDIYDSGPGIPTETRLSLFTPFFTTKKTGLGLGLATSQKIVREHHGEMSVESPLKTRREPFHTKFTIALPT
jgi:PAS domain S-box-containing protein